MTQVLWFHTRPLHPLRGGADLRVDGLIRAALLRGHRIMLLTPGPLDGPTWPGVTLLEVTQPSAPRALRVTHRLMSRQPLGSPQVGIRHRSDIRRAVEDFGPGLVVVSELTSWAMADVLAPKDVPVVYDAHNVEGKLGDDLVRLGGDRRARALARLNRARIGRTEATLLRQAEVTITPAPGDAARLSRTALRPVHVVPSTVPDPGQRAGPLTSRPTMLFTGTLDYPPNEVAVIELTETVLPQVRRHVPDAELVVVGRSPSRRVVAAIERCVGAQLVVDAPNLRPFYDAARVVVMPIRTGSGTKLKAVEALAHGVPVVATEEAMSGISLSATDVLIGGTADDIVRHVTSVLRDGDLARLLGESGRRLYLRSFSVEAVAVALDPVWPSSS